MLGHGESTIGCSYSYLLTLAIGTLIATTLPQIASIDHLSRLHHDNTMATANGLNGTHSEKPEYDAIVVGAGFAGLRIIHELRNLGLKYKVFEAGTGVGGKSPYQQTEAT